MSWRPTAALSAIKARAQLYQQIRAFFLVTDCLEVDTPLLSPATNTDANIDSITADNRGVMAYLQTSPEFAMKRLLAAGSGSIFQIAHAYRAGEQGKRHRSEFTLLEWYRVGFDYQVLMDEVERLIDDVSGVKNGFQRISYQAIFQQQLDIDITLIELNDLRAVCAKWVSGCNSDEFEFDQCLDLLISITIAPAMQGYVFVYNYPISQAALARPSQENPQVAERFELFHDGLELANGFSELTDATMQRQRFLADNQKRHRHGQVQYPLDEPFLKALEAGLPDCAGVALGLDRLLMVLLRLDRIDEVMSF